MSNLKIDIRNNLSSDILNKYLKNINDIETYNLPITRKPDGSIMSMYEDDIWNFTHYRSNNTQSPNIFFNKFNNSSSRKHAKRILFLYILNFGNRSSGSTIAYSSIYNFYKNCFIPISNFLNNRKIELNDFLRDESEMLKYVSTITAYNKIKFFYTLIEFLKRISSKQLGFEMNKNLKLMLFIEKKRSQLYKEATQTITIPSRIYCLSIIDRLEQIKLILKHKKGLKDLINLKMGKDFKNYSQWDRQKIFKNIIIKNKFEKLTEEFGYTKFESRDLKAFISKIQTTCRHLILALTGMRDGEVLSLKCKCWEKNDNNTLIIRGLTTKFKEAKIETKWLGSSLLIDVFNLLEYINKNIAERYNINFIEMPLFWSSTLLENSNKSNYSDEYLIEKKIFTAKMSHLESKRSSGFKLSNMGITSEDIEELKKIDLDFNYKKIKDVEIGYEWKFKSHQYRRTIAVYTIQSGIISIGSLQNQFKHLFREMSLYYSNGATRAKSLFGINELDDYHIGNYINKISPDIQTSSYLNYIIFSESEFFGSHGIFIEKNIKSKLKNNELEILEFREETKKQIQRGEKIFKSTILGGCVSPYQCDKRMLRSLYGCVTCDSSIIEKIKYKQLIDKQKEFINSLNKDSYEYKFEKENLIELEKGYKKLIGEIYE
jgi:integrase